MLLGSSIPHIYETGWAALMFPLYVSSIGAMSCIFMRFLAEIMPVRKEEDIDSVFKMQLLGAALMVTGLMYPVAVGVLPEIMGIDGVFLGGTLRVVTSVNLWGCVLFGVWAGTITAFITEHYTSHSYTPTRDVAKASETGAATVIIYGLALGYLSTIIPVALIAGIISPLRTSYH
jgi:Na+/H+-translocating membrane pyrophosphatase